MNDKRATYRTVGGVLIAVNVLLAVVKLYAWKETGSIALQSEALNSIVDIVYSAIVFAGLYATTQEPSSRFPDGYRRLEPFVSLFIAIGILSTGGALLWNAATVAVQGGHAVTNTPVALTVLVGSSIVKIGLYKYCLSYGQETGSTALVAVAIDNRNDVLTAVAAFVGVIGAWSGYLLFDSLAAGVVAMVIIYGGVDIAVESIGHILGRAPSNPHRDEIIDGAISHPEVYGVHDVCIRYQGPMLDVAMHIEVEGDLTVEEAHDVEVGVADRIRSASGERVERIDLHVDPESLNEWKTDEEETHRFQPPGSRERGGI